MSKNFENFTEAVSRISKQLQYPHGFASAGPRRGGYEMTWGDDHSVRLTLPRRGPVTVWIGEDSQFSDKDLRAVNRITTSLHIAYGD